MLRLSGVHCVGFDALIEIFGEIDVLGRAAIVEHQAPAVGFIAGLHLRTIGDPFSVGRIDGAPVVGGIRGDSSRRARAGNRYGKEITVGAARFVFIGIGGETQFAAVRRKRNRFGSFQIEGRHVVGRARGEIARRAAVCGRDEEMAALTVPPAGPMAIQQFFVYRARAPCSALFRSRAGRCRRHLCSPDTPRK